LLLFSTDYAIIFGKLFVLEDPKVKKKVVTVLLIVALLLFVVTAAAAGFLWYRDNHIFVEGVAYSIHAAELDLREEDISLAHYDAVHAQLPDCRIVWNVPFRGGRYPNDTREMAIPDLQEQDVQMLKTYFPNFEKLDATGCTDYALLERVCSENPSWTVLYQVDIGGTAYPPDTTGLELENGQYDYDTLMENLPHLPKVTSMFLHTPELSLEQIGELKERFPEIAVACTVSLMGQEFNSDTEELDLSKLSAEELPGVLEKLPMLPNLSRLELMDGDSSSLSKADVKSLMDAMPQASIHYTFDLFGQTLSTEQEEVSYKNQRIGDEGEAELRQALDIMPQCTRLILDNCHFSNDVLAQLREDYRGRTKIVWRVWFGEGGSSLTDATAIRAVYGLVDDNCHDLVYCEDVVYMDIGHDEYLDACDFIAGMPNLEYVILSGSPIKSLEPFRACKRLKFLEIAFCEYVTDLSPLADCESLEMLNISNTHVKDLSPLDELPLTHLCALLNPGGGSRISQEEQARFIEKHPDCWSTFTGSQPYGIGWRYDEDNITPLTYYQQIRDVFMYDKDPNIPNNVGWYYEEKTQWTNPN